VTIPLSSFDKIVSYKIGPIFAVFVHVSLIFIRSFHQDDYRTIMRYSLGQDSKRDHRFEKNIIIE
jgi:hypothetical protein